MTPGVETRIWLALRQRVTSLPGGLAIDWPGSDFTPPADDGGPLGFVEVRQVQSPGTRILIGSQSASGRAGVLQLSLMVPIARGVADAAVAEMAGQMAAHFPADLKLRFMGLEVRIERAADIAAGYRDGVYWRVPVSVRWRAYA
ncbi:hypothetical protein AEAC466_13455 [Asticcacaulis sp. AC466]|uniref:phage tail terminator-like protein n=1 Tax=Asticcacaulis sp. AC466 TaxID=1282362 RepID=UPI0003C3B616|nr:phage tail terminator-like protein [Asticcacaulis sp. AC466]ESQ83253.1 hypothetical protein AEAC466_13455 [Asticcacaulis sp. AC466]